VRAAGFQSSPNHGRLLESLVAIACLRRQLRGESRIYYWKDPHRSLIKAGHELRCDNLLLLNPDEQGEGRETWQGRSAIVRREPIWRWLLEQR
jgi:hypothetical protein